MRTRTTIAATLRPLPAPPRHPPRPFWSACGAPTIPAGSTRSPVGISSGGPTLPLLFGRGSMMARSGTGSQLSVTTGITVRATAIAAAGDGITFSGTSGTYSAGRAKSAGPPYQGPDASGNAVNIPGTTPFSITASAWSSMTVGTAQAFQSSGGTGEVQWFGAPPTGVIQIGQLAPLPVGTTTLAATTGTAAIATNKGYVPISNTYYDESNNAYNVIIGFGYAGWNWDGTYVEPDKAPVGACWMGQRVGGPRGRCAAAHRS